MKVQELEVRELEVKETESKIIKVRELEVTEKEIRKSNPIVILGGMVDMWMAGTSGADVLVKYITTASIFHPNFRKLRREGLCLNLFMMP